MRALVTGISGFVGQHLTRALLSEGWEVWGCSLRGLPQGNALPPCVRVLTGDLEQPEVARHALQEARPEAIFHLAARAAVGPSHADPWGTLRANIAMQVHLLEAVRQWRPQAVVLVVGSSEEYGLASPAEMPLREDSPLRPRSPYAVSKLAQDFLGLQYHLAYGLHIVRVRPFNHIGPGQGPGFVAADFARQVAEAEMGQREPTIRVGNLEAARDFTDVRDVVNAYRLLARQGQAGEVYNVASGRAIKISALLELMLACSRVPIKVIQDESRMRPSDTPLVYGDYGKLHACTGWQPTIPLEVTVQDVLEYWRAQLRKG